MALLVPNSGEEKMLEYVVGISSTASLWIALYDDSDPNLDTGTLTDSTATLVALEAAEAGLSDDTSYARVQLSAINWVIATDGGGITTATYNTAVDFTFNGSGSPAEQTIWGYFVMDDGGNVVGAGNLLWAERFGIDVNLGASGGIVSVIPQISLD